MHPEGSSGTGQRRGSVLRNTFFLAVAETAGRVVSLVFFTLAARHLGVVRFGILSFSLAFVSMFSVLSDLGIGTLAIREIARDRSAAPDLVRRGISIRLLASTVVTLVVVAAAALLAYPVATVCVVAICSTTVVSGGVILFYASVLQGFEHNSYTALARAAQTAVMVAGALLLARQTAPAVAGYALVLAGASMIAAMAVSVVVWVKFVPLSLDFDFRRWLPMLRRAVPFGVTTILVAFYYWSGSTILSKMAGQKAVGEFGAAFRLVAGVGFLGASFSGAVYPVISRVFATEPSRWPATAGRALRLILNLAVPQAMLGFTLAGPVIGILYGRGYEGSVPVMMALAWWGACATLNSMLSSMLFATDRQRIVTVQAGISVAVSVVLNLALIPVLGALGAAIALSAAEAAGTAFLFVSCYKTSTSWRPAGVVPSIARAGVAAGAAAVAAMLCARWNPWVGIALALPAYATLLVLCGGVQPEDVETVRLALRRVSV